MQTANDIFSLFSASWLAGAVGTLFTGAVCFLLSLTAFYSAPKIVGAELLPQDERLHYNS